jgi:hypothetical protein
VFVYGNDCGDGGSGHNLRRTFCDGRSGGSGGEMMGVLFCTIFIGWQFCFGDNPDRILTKIDEDAYTDQKKVYTINPHVLVFPK